MKVDDKSYLEEKKAYESNLKSLKERNNNLVKNHEGHLKNVSEHHFNQIESQKAMHEQDKLEMHDRAKAEMSEFLTRQQQTMDRYRDNLEKTKKILEDAEKNSAMTTKDRIIQKQIEDDELITSTTNQLNEKIKNIADTGNVQIHKMINDVDNQKNQVRSKQNMEALSSGGVLRNDISETNRKFVEKRNFVNKEYEDNLKLIEKTQKDHLVNVDRKHLIVKQQQLNTNQQELANVEKKYQQTLKDTHNRYALKIAQMNKENMAVIKNVENSFKKQIDEMKQKQIEAKNILDNRITDPFYQMLDISPTIEDLGTEYQVSVKVPEHEKEGVLLTPHERKIRVSFTRRFDDRVTTPEGFNKSARSESSLQEYSVPEILDSTKVTQSYQDGTLMFKIAKK